MRKLIIAGSGFAGGLLAGYLVSQNKDEFDRLFKVTRLRVGRWSQNANQHRENLTELGKQQVSNFSKELKRNLSDPIPDLYKATESMTVDDLNLKLPK